jgi:hypothetical protein
MPIYNKVNRHFLWNSILKSLDKHLRKVEKKE